MSDAFALRRKEAAAVDTSRQGYEGEHPGLLLAEQRLLDRYLQAITMLHTIVGA